MSYGHNYICQENAGDQHFNIADHCDADTQIGTVSEDGTTYYYDMEGVDFDAFAQWVFDAWEVDPSIYGYDGYEEWAFDRVDSESKSISW